MVDDRSEDSGPPGDAGRPRREPPTIDLKATDVSTTPQDAAEAEAEPAQAGAAPEEHVVSAAKPVSAPVSPWAIAPISGAVAAALVIAVGWALGWPTVQAPPPAVQLNAGAIDGLTTRIAGLETKTNKPASPVADPAAAARMETIEKSVAALRSELLFEIAVEDRNEIGLWKEVFDLRVFHGGNIRREDHALRHFRVHLSLQRLGECCTGPVAVT